MKSSSSLSAALALVFMNVSLVSDAAELKLGMIGLDTSHVTAFTRLLNDSSHPDHIPGARVVVAFKGGSADVEASATRVDGFTRQLENDFGVRIVPTLEELCQEVDAVLLESVDGRPHLEQVRPVILAGKPVFIDKPLAGSLKDAIAIYRLAKAHNVPWFSSSSYRFYDSMQDLKKVDVGEVKGAISYGPCSLEPHHPDLFWYGVHPTEALFTILGRGCETVTRVSTPDTDVVTGVWGGGVVGTLRGIRNASSPHEVIVFGSKKVARQAEGPSSYAPLLKEVIRFFETKQPPITPEETIEMFAFMEAADESKRQGGRPVRLDDVLRSNGWE